jgi:hypothetical protein
MPTGSGGSSGHRAFTNPFSNTVVLSRFNLGEGVDVAARQQLPIRCLPQFLHETMHHWCFDSPVGMAIFLLQMRARRAAVSALFNDVTGEIQRKIADDAGRVACFQEFMRPVNEGLALFAEHDAYPGESEVIGRPTFLAGFLFAGWQTDPQAYIALTPAVLKAGRLTAAHVRRKADLLIQPFTGTADGYLAGYLFLRLMYRIVAERCSAYLDSDFFLHFLRCWLFDDWDLVDLILDDSIDYEACMERLVMYCQQRLGNFINLPHDELTSGFEQRGVAAEADLFEYKGAHLHLESYSHPVIPLAAEARGKVRLRSLFDELFGQEPSQDVARYMFHSDLDVLGLRTTLTLGHAQFDATVTSGRMLQLRTEGFPFPVFSTGSPDNLKPGWHAKVNVDLLLITAPPGLFQFVTGEDGHIMTNSFGSSQEPPEYINGLMANWEKREEKMAREDLAIDQVLGGSTEELLLEVTVGRVTRTRDEVFELKGLLLTPDELIEKAKHLLSEDGFLRVMGGNVLLVLDAAALSLCAGLRIRPTAALPDWRWSCGDELASSRRINELFQGSLGYKPFLIHEGQVLFSMI